MTQKGNLLLWPVEMMLCRWIFFHKMLNSDTGLRNRMKYNNTWCSLTCSKLQYVPHRSCAQRLEALLLPEQQL